MKKSYLIQGVALEGKVRFAVCNATSIVEEARVTHDLWPVCSAALGRTLMGTALLASSIKGKEKISVIINGRNFDGSPGATGSIVTEAVVKEDESGQYISLRGTISNPQVDHNELKYKSRKVGKLPVGLAVGPFGTIRVINDLGLKENFGGEVNLRNGEIAEDFAYYLAKSQQIPSVVSLGVLVESDNTIISSGGLLLQLMPGASEEEISYLENLAKTLPQISGLIKDKTPEEIINEIFSDAQILAKKDLVYKCNCSYDHTVSVLESVVDLETLKSIREETGFAEITCHFCNTSYIVEKEKLDEIISRLQSN